MHNFFYIRELIYIYKFSYIIFFLFYLYHTVTNIYSIK
nr:MAG TPA: hypothetical protein [Bacteriophage sp.]